MNKIETKIAGVIEIEPRVFPDDRGFFYEAFNAKAFADLGLPTVFVQENQSHSKAGTIRGLHYQAAPDPQSKLVLCTRGRIFDVAVDVRSGSPTYGQWFGTELVGGTGKQLFIPAGCLHGFYAMEDSEVRYLVDYPWNKTAEGSVLYNDPDLAIEWPIVAPPIVSEKDLTATRFADFTSPF